MAGYKKRDMFGLGYGEIILIVIVILLLFGAKRIPELMRNLGKGLKGFKDGLDGKDEKASDEESSEKT